MVLQYAIRYAIRASPLERDEVIRRVADVIGPRHKVNLNSPDKIILVEIFKASLRRRARWFLLGFTPEPQLTDGQNFCGMSVVDGEEYERLRRYNIHEIYKLVDSKRV
jgi:tRNA acetyltransferase TAN1